MKVILNLEFIQDEIKYYSLQDDLHFQYRKEMYIIKHQTFITKYTTYSAIIFDYLRTNREVGKLKACLILMYLLKLENHSFYNRLKVSTRAYFILQLKKFC